jgi:hypothetical protein
MWNELLPITLLTKASRWTWNLEFQNQHSCDGHHRTLERSGLLCQQEIGKQKEVTHEWHWRSL